MAVICCYDYYYYLFLLYSFFFIVIFYCYFCYFTFLLRYLPLHWCWYCCLLLHVDVSVSVCVCIFPSCFPLLILRRLYILPSILLFSSLILLLHILPTLLFSFHYSSALHLSYSVVAVGLAFCCCCCCFYVVVARACVCVCVADDVEDLASQTEIAYGIQASGSTMTFFQVLCLPSLTFRLLPSPASLSPRFFPFLLVVHC